MSLPRLGIIGDKEDENNLTLLEKSLCLNVSKPKEFNYMGLSSSSSSNCSSVDSPVPKIQSFSDETKSNLNLKATELRLGLPGSLSPERDSSDLFLRSSNQFDEKPLFPLHPQKDDHLFESKAAVLGNKRGFSDAMDVFSEGKLKPSSKLLESVAAQKAKADEIVTVKVGLERPHGVGESRPSLNGSVHNGNSIAPASKAQVVGWPPIRSFRKNSLTTASKNTEEVDGKLGSGGAVFVKVSMDGAPYLRKVDLKNYAAYSQLSSALEKMFSCFTIGQCESHGNQMLNETKLRDLLHGSEYVITYEDKDGDWMLVGDVPWEMFIDTCKRLRIMKSSDAIGLAPRAVEKSKSRN
ncbi:auxin-responsive protein IAA8-like isoform X2 [Trifolium pratense]|uniref:auxin-responsive protein IAA8-like isoform X2 n=1 Tax=Trifolium pratense TaxID=57577 RepID=UPI001E69333E|nr:auxin-responsive protein IAA8-like isoform X2 [Trifolium pratense]